MPMILLLLFGFLLFGASQAGKKPETEEERKRREAQERLGKARQLLEFQQEREERERATEERKRQEEQKTERLRLQALAQRALEWRHRIHVERNFLDPEYREHFARAHTKEILQVFRPQWAKEYSESKGDQEFCAYLRRNAVDLHDLLNDWLEARLDVIWQAEKLAVMPPPSSTRKKPTPEEVTTRMVARLKMKLRDQEAVFKAAQGWLEEQEEEMLSGIEDDDEREAMRNRIKEILGKVLSDFYGKENDNGSTRL